MVLFYPPPHYKSIWPQEEQDKQFWNKIAIKFFKKKYNTDIIRKKFLIEMYIGELPHKPYFIALTLQEQIIVGPTKKMVASYMVGDLALLD